MVGSAQPLATPSLPNTRAMETSPAETKLPSAPASTSPQQQQRLGKQIKDAAFRAIDLALLPAVLVFGVASLWLWRQQKRMPVSKRLLRRMAVFPGKYHYYTPAVREADLYRDPAMPRPLPAIDWNVDGQKSMLAKFRYGDELRKIPTQAFGKRSFRYDYGAFPPGDADLLFSFVRQLKPVRIIEIGSGNSTLMALEAIAANVMETPGYACELTCVEPYAHPWLEHTPAKIVRSRVEVLGIEFFDGLAANDILFIDSSHVVRAQNDVVFEILDVLPRLKPGVFVHIHDIFSPRDLSRRWLIDDNRQWGEQYLVEAFLSFNTSFEVVCAANMLFHDARADLIAACPMLGEQVRAEPGSLWLRRV